MTLDRQPNRELPTVRQVLDTTTLPDPTIAVPFEKFASLHDSDDMLVRAAFWCFYAAWQADSNGRGPADIPVEARHDGHQLRAITNELAIRDAVLIRRRDLELLQQPHAPYLVTYGALGFCMVIMLVLGFLLGVGLF